MSRRKKLGCVQPSTPDRRTLLRAGGGVLCGPLAGCMGGSEPPTLDLSVFNHTTTPYTVELSLFRVDRDGRSEARTYDASLDVPADDGAVEREAVAEVRRYVVRYSAYQENSRLTDQAHIHYYPTGDDDTIALDINPNGRVSYRG